MQYRAAIAGVVALFSHLAMAEEKKPYALDFYGKAHLSLDDSQNTVQEDTKFASNSSRLGLKGHYQIDPGVTLLGQVERGIDLTGQGRNDGNGRSSTGSLFTRARATFVGVETDYGTVKYGRQSALNQWLYDYNLFADQVGDLGNIWGTNGLAGRANDVFSYQTPNYRGLDALVLYTDESGDAADDSIALLKLNYHRDGIALGGSYAKAASGRSGGSDLNVAALTASYTTGHWNVYGLDLQGSSVGAGYQRDRDIAGNSANDRDAYTLGAALKLSGQHILKAQYTRSDSDITGADGDQFAVGYDYAFDKNLTLYAAYATTDNDINAAFTSNNYGHGKSLSPDRLGGDPSTISVGLVYAFDYGLDTVIASH